MDTALKPAPSPVGEKTFLGHPFGLTILFLTEMWERFSFYGMRALLVLYLTQHFLFSDQQAYGIYGSYMALGYATPVIGGYLADHYLGEKNCITIGAILMCLGHLGMAFEGPTATEVSGQVVRSEFHIQIFYFSLALLIIGIGFLKPNVTTIVGKLYPENDPRKESAYTLFQMGIMLGAATSAAICGYLGQTYGWSYGFGLAGIGMLIGLIVFRLGQKHLGGQAEAKDPEKIKMPALGALKIWHVLVLGTAASVLLSWLLVQLPSVSRTSMSVFSLTTIAVVLWIAFKSDRVERNRMLVLLVFFMFMVIFAALYEQAGSSLNLFAERHVDKSLFGLEIKTSQLQSTAPTFIILLAPLFAWLWMVLERHRINPSTPGKYIISIFLMGVGFLFLYWMGKGYVESAQVPVIWLILTYFIFAVSDIFIAAVCYASVSKLAPPKHLSMLMGCLMLAIAYANIISAAIASLTVVKKEGGGVVSPQEAFMSYQNTFWLLGIGSVVLSAIFFAFLPMMKKYMHGIK